MLKTKPRFNKLICSCNKHIKWEGKIPPMVIPYLVAELFDAFGKNEEAEQIRTYLTARPNADEDSRVTD